MQEQDWDFLLQRIENGECTPLLGPAVNHGLLTPREELAARWTAEFNYPLPDTDRFARVAQYLSFQRYQFFPNDQIAAEIRQAGQPDFSAPGQVHAALADLHLPLYVTTNYDDFMFHALQQRKREPRRGVCAWNRLLSGRLPELPTDYRPKPATPLVYHLHGHYESPESLVLREDDYLDFLVHMTSNEYRLPPPVMQALSETSLLFIGYDPTDWEFRVLLRGLVRTTDARMRRISVTAQFPLPPDTPPAVQQRAEQYLSTYFRDIDREMRVFWGTAADFLAELRRRMAAGAAEKADEGTVDGAPRIDQIRLFNLLNQAFTLEDLRNLAFELGIDQDNLPTIKKSMARQLILELKNRQRLPELVTLCRRERPEVEW